MECLVPWPSIKVFGVIIHECVANEVTEIYNNCVYLKPGILIQIVPYYRSNGCYFKMRDFTNWLTKYKTSIYKCSYNDYISVTKELWPYLVASKTNEARIEFVLNVNSCKFDVDMLKLGREVNIRGPPYAKMKYYEFIVSYNGVVREIGPGYFIGLKLKNGSILSTSDLKYFAQYYRHKRTELIVSADWIMMNLYKIDECPDVSTNTSQHNKTCYSDTTVDNIELNNKHKDSEIIVYPTVVLCPNKDCNFSWMQQSSNEIKMQRCSKCKANWCYICNNFHEPDDEHKNRTNLTTEYSTIYESGSAEPLEEQTTLSATGAIPKQSHRHVELETSFDKNRNMCRTVLEYASVKNLEKTKCDLCDITVEIGRGRILRDCIHSFCVQCIRDHVERNLKYNFVQCPYNKDYDCKCNLFDPDIQDVMGYSEIMNSNIEPPVISNQESAENKIDHQLVTSRANGVKNDDSRTSTGDSKMTAAQIVLNPVDFQNSNSMYRNSFEPGKLDKLKMLPSVTQKDVVSLDSENNSNVPNSLGILDRYVNKPYYCCICHKLFDLHATKLLLLCNCDLCVDCIVLMFNIQLKGNKTLNCPLCCSPVKLSCSE